jgi:hypothetical protein
MSGREMRVVVRMKKASKKASGDIPGSLSFFTQEGLIIWAGHTLEVAEPSRHSLFCTHASAQSQKGYRIYRFKNTLSVRHIATS